MSEQSHRMVVAFRTTARSTESGRLREDALRVLVANAATQGARLIAWLPPIVICDFPRDGWEAAMALVCGSVGDASFAVGVAEGVVRTVLEQAGRLVLGVGRVVREAACLARRARPGEVLIHLGVSSARGGRMLVSGKRYWLKNGRIGRAGRLDLRHPLLLPPVESLGRLSPSAWVGVPPDQAVEMAPARLTVLHAPPGFGASRFFRELEGRRANLRLGPGVAGEPLGALRRAFVGMPEVSSRVQRESGLLSSMERLLAGAGLRPADAAALVLGWTRVVGREAVVFVEDPQRVDTESLDAVLVGIGDASVLVRSRDGRVPPGFDRLPMHAEVELDAISEEEALVVLQSMAGASLDAAVAARYAKRGGYVPLGITEAIAASLERGELAWDEGKLIARGRVAGRGRPRTAAHWMMQRLDRLEAQEREVLDALAVLGGEAEAGDLAWLSERGAITVQLGPLTRALNAERWLRRSGERMVALSSDSLLRRLVEVMPPRRRAELHRLVADRFEGAGRPLLAGAAAVHAQLAGDTERAGELGRKMALLCRVNQLDQAATVFERFASRGDFGELVAHKLAGSWTAADVVALPSDAPRRVQPVPSATRVAARAKRGATRRVGTSPPSEGDAALPRALPGEGRLAQVLARVDSARVEAVGRCRKLLAAALWHARSGDDLESMLWCLEALAEARRRDDARGALASVLLAMALSRKAGDETACAAWQARFESLR